MGGMRRSRWAGRCWSGLASGLVETMREIGGAIGVAAVSTPAQVHRSFIHRHPDPHAAVARLKTNVGGRS